MFACKGGPNCVNHFPYGAIPLLPKNYIPNEADVHSSGFVRNAWYDVNTVVPCVPDGCDADRFQCLAMARSLKSPHETLDPASSHRRRLLYIQVDCILSV